MTLPDTTKVHQLATAMSFEMQILTTGEPPCPKLSSPGRRILQRVLGVQLRWLGQLFEEWNKRDLAAMATLLRGFYSMLEGIALSITTLGILMMTMNQSILLISLPDIFAAIPPGSSSRPFERALALPDSDGHRRLRNERSSRRCDRLHHCAEQFAREASSAHPWP
jgi:hypothetical protein